MILLVRVATRDDGDPVADRATTTTTEAVADAPDEDADGDLADDATTTTAGSDAAPDLRAALLTLADLPSGWSVASDAGAVDELCAGSDPLGEAPPDDLVQAGFSGGDAGPVLSNVIAEYEDDAGAAGLLEAVRDSLDACATFATSTGSYALRETDLGDFGDDRVAATLSGQTDAGEIEGQLVYVRVGDRVGAVAVVAFGTSDPAIAREAIGVVAERL